LTHFHPLFVALGHDDEIHRQLAVHGLDGAEGVELRHLRALGIGGAAADEHLLVGRLFDETRFEGRVLPRIRLRHRHRVVHPVDEHRLLGALITLGVDHRIARRAVLGDARIVDLRLLAAELVEEALHHLGRLGNAFP
jgi:hypothetical protein